MQPELFNLEHQDQNIEDLKRILDERHTWVPSSVITLLTGWSDRTIRALAAHSGGWIISGQKGYKYILHATPEEAHHSSSWLISQGKQMIARGISQRRRAHSLVG
jgi:hypothetical protein